MDLRGCNRFMLDVDRLLTSELVATGSAVGCWAAVMLWCYAWKQVPPGSLPDDDKILRKFATISVRQWTKYRTIALRGFVKCSDGRLYHRVLCEEVNRAWDQRQKFKERSFRGNQKRWAKQPQDQWSGEQDLIQQGSNKESLLDPARILVGSHRRDVYVEKEERKKDRSIESVGSVAAREANGTLTPLAPDWRPSKAIVEYCTGHGIEPAELAAEIETFRDHHIARGHKRADWEAELRKWLAKRRQFPAEAKAGPKPFQPYIP